MVRSTSLIACFVLFFFYGDFPADWCWRMVNIFFLVIIWCFATLETVLFFGQSIRRARPFPWQHDLFEDSLRAAGIQGVEVGTKLYVSNLDHGVTNEDIRVYTMLYHHMVLLVTVSTQSIWKFSWNLICNSGTFLWAWRVEAFCCSLWQKWTSKCKYWALCCKFSYPFVVAYNWWLLFLLGGRVLFTIFEVFLQNNWLAIIPHLNIIYVPESSFVHSSFVLCVWAFPAVLLLVFLANCLISLTV